MFLPALGLIAAAFLAYFPILQNKFVWDDDYYIQENVQLLSGAGLGRIWTQIGSEPQYYPLTHTTFWVEYHFWGADPFHYHLDNLLLHTLSAIVLWRLLLRLGIPGAWGAALIFCVHPVQVESVAWATERKNVLSGVLYLLSASAYFRSAPRPSPFPGNTGETGSSVGWYVASLMLFFAALLAKSVTSTLPAAILLLTWWRDGRLRWRDVLPLLPMFAAGAAMGILTSWMEKHVVGAIGPDFDFSLFQRFVLAGWAVWFYLGKLVLPIDLSFIYPRWNLDPAGHAWQILFSLALLGVLLILWRCRRISRGPLTAALYFAGTLLPALGFANVFPMRYSFVADHFQYLACIGPIAVFFAAVWKYFPRGALPVALALGVACCIASEARCRVFYDSQTLWKDTLVKNPDSAAAHANIGQTLADQSDWAGAEAEFRRALELRPSDGALCIKIGVCRAAVGDNAGAIWWYQKALDHLPDSDEPVLHRLRSEPYYRMGCVYGSMPGDENRQLAIDAYKQAIQINPDYELAMDNLGELLLEAGQTGAAIAEFESALKVNPDSVPAHNNLGNAYLAEGNFQQASAEYESVLRLAPSNVNALNNLGTVNARQGKWPEAIADFQLALRIDPDFALAKRNLAAALMHERGQP
ncbi:MAG: tetratricopeptide repeat protein [Tepidisphaeraceae bacterium]